MRWEHQLDGTLRVFRGDQLLLTQSLPLQEHPDRRCPEVEEERGARKEEGLRVLVPLLGKRLQRIG